MRINHFRVGLLVLALFLGQYQVRAIVILGRDDNDKVLTKFWQQNGNASNLIAGVSANAAGAKFSDAVLPALITGKTWSGTFTGTNSFKLQTWDSVLSLMQSFEFFLTNNVPLSTNTVSRVGFPEQLT